MISFIKNQTNKCAYCLKSSLEDTNIEYVEGNVPGKKSIFLLCFFLKNKIIFSSSLISAEILFVLVTESVSVLCLGDKIN